MGYEMQLTDKQWFNLICGMNAGLMGLEKGAPHSSAKTEDKQIDSSGEMVVTLPSDYSFMAVPLTYENDGFTASGTGSIGSYFHVTNVSLDRIEIYPEPGQQYRELIIERVMSDLRKYIGKVIYVNEVVSQQYEIDVFTYGRGAVNYNEVIEFDTTIMVADVIYHIVGRKTLIGWVEAHQGHENLCVAGGGNTRNIYFEWKIYAGPVDGANSLVGKHVKLSFKMGSYSGGRVYTAYYGGAQSIMSELPDGATATQTNICGATVDIPVFPAPSPTREAGYVGKLRFGPVSNPMVEGAVTAYVEEESIAVIEQLIVNNEKIVDRRSEIYWASSLVGNPEIVYYSGHKSRWGYAIFGQVPTGVVTEPSTQTSVNSATTVTSTEASARPSGVAEISRLIEEGIIYEKNNQLVYIMTDGDPKNKSVQEINSLINKFGYVGYSCVMNCTEAQTLYFYVADKATGEALTPAVPVSAQVGSNEITVKIPLVSEDGLCDEYDIKYFVERTYDSSFDSLEEAEAANAVSNNGTTTIDAGATVISQSTQGAPPLPIMPYGEDKIIVEDEISVTVRTIQGDVDLTADDTVTVEDDVDVLSHYEYNGESDIEETVTVEDDIDFTSQYVYPGESDIEETVAVADDIDVTSREVFNGTIRANETSSISDDISSTST